MQTTAIILCSGMDDSLLGTDIAPFEYGIVSPYDMKPIDQKYMSYVYNRVDDSDGQIKNNVKEHIIVDNLYDFFHHLFAPLSTARRLYSEFAVKEKADGTVCSEYQIFRYFKLDSEKEWDEEGRCLLDAIRLFKTSRSGFGIGVLPEGGVGVNDLYQWSTDYCLWGHLPVFTLNDNEKKEFQRFYHEFREWYFDSDLGSKDQLAKVMLELFRSAYRCSDVETSFMVLSGIWELFSQQFPEKGSRIGGRVTKRIKQSVSRMVRNGGKVMDKAQANLYMKVGYLYNQRSIIVHKDKDETFDKECIPMAFDLTRCLILKLFYAKDRNIEDIVKKLEYCEDDKAAYPVDSVRWMVVSDDLLEKIFKPFRSNGGQTGPHA